MTKEGYTKIVNFMTPVGGVIVLGRRHMSYSKNALFLLKSSQLQGIDQTNQVWSSDYQGNIHYNDFYEIYNFVTPFLGHHYYTQCLGVEKKIL